MIDSTIKHFAPFGFTTATTPFSMSINIPGVGSNTFTITGSFFHTISGSIEGSTYKRFDQTFESAVDTAGITELTCSYNANEAKYYLFVPSLTPASFSFGNTGSSDAMGFAEANVWYPFEGLLTSSNRCYYQWDSRLSERADWSDLYENEGKTIEQVADDGTVYSLGRTATRISDDWTHTFELKSNIRCEASQSTNPYVWEKHIDYISSILPWFIVSGNNGAVSASMVTRVYKMRAESALFAPNRSIANLDRYWDFNVGASLVRNATLSGGLYLKTRIGS